MTLLYLLLPLAVIYYIYSLFSTKFTDVATKGVTDYEAIQLDRIADLLDPVSDRPAHIYISKEEKQSYLHSNEWNIIRKARLAIDRYTCTKCGNQGVSLEVHHLNYRSWKHENMEDLTSLCRDCHQSIHDEQGYTYNKEYVI